ncbi:MAG: hypothetical protein ACRD1H_09495 [Vicinamibacterales bacterium]
MDVLIDIGKALLALGLLGLVVILIPILFMFIFSIATGIDSRMSR